MKVRALISFVGQAGEKKFRPNPGDIFDLPPGTDWIRAGFVVPIEGEAEEEPPAAKSAPETTAVQPPENAALAKPKRRDGVMSTEDLRPTEEGN